MGQNLKRKWTSLALALLMLLSAILPINVARAATPSTLDASVAVTGVSEGGTIDGSTGIGITVNFPVPVLGDGVDDYFQHNDEVTLLLSTSFMFDPVPAAPITLYHGGKSLGTVTLGNNASGQAIATIKFDGDEDIFDPSKLPSDGTPAFSGISAWFNADLTYNDTHNTDDAGNKTVSILEKTYKLQLPGDIITHTVEKEVSSVNLAEGTIMWAVTITATSDTEPATHIDLKDYVFEDDLANVGTYVTGSFSLSGGTLVVPDPDGAPPTTKLAYTFPAGSTSPQTITFKTTIPPAKLSGGGNITNRADLLQNGTSVDNDDAEAIIPTPSVTKTFDAEGEIGDIYNPTNRTITWYVEVDNNGRTLNNLTITDVLTGGLTLQAAQWQRWDAGTSQWADVGSGTWVSEPTDSKYVIGDVNYRGRLKIITEVPNDANGSVIRKTYYNQASATWTYEGGGAGSGTTGNPGVGIGYDAITKSGTQSTAEVASHQVTWTINVAMKTQIATGYAVYDLFVHDKNTTDIDLTDAANWPAGLSIGPGDITRNNGQMYIGMVSKDDHLTYEVIPLYKGGSLIATLVKITGIQSTGSNQVKLSSQILDPEILAGNKSDQKATNTAALYFNTIHGGNATATVDYENQILAKEMLKRAEVANDHTGGTINANERTTNKEEGFHYGYKEVIFRLNVNAAGLDFATVESNLSGGFGPVTVTDILPEGWEFADFSSGSKYLIYDGNGNADGTVTATGTPLSASAIAAIGLSSPIGGRTATFTFNTLNKPYVILVKARPTDATFDGYLTGANTRDVTNTLGLYSANWNPGVSVTQKVTVNSKILEKTLDLSKQSQGILIWTVNYTPFGREIGTGLEDTLPQGIDLRTDSSGQLIWEQDGSRNINVYEMTLNPDGSDNYVLGTQLPLNELKSCVSYNTDTRKLTFAFPDETKAYRMAYVTDITGMPGAVTNAVKLVDATGSGTSTNESFSITAQQGAATMGRSGYLVLKKTDTIPVILSGAKFTLYNTNADGSRGFARAERITNNEGLAWFYGLVPGTYILVETGSPSGYQNNPLEYNVVVGSDLRTTVSGSGIITDANPFVVVNYRESDQVGTLTVRKTVAGNDMEPGRKFEFIITLSDTLNTYTYIGANGGPSGTIRGNATIQLAGGQSATIAGLPQGVTYTVTEEDYTPYRYVTTKAGEAGTIVADVTAEAVFTNTRNAPGSLTVSKTVMGNAAEEDKKFEFTITLSDKDNTYTYAGANGGPSGTIKGSATIALAGGQSITIAGLREHTTYEVTEKDYSAEGYTTAKAGDTGRIETNGTYVAAFTNTKNSSSGGPTGGLMISKRVAGNGASATKKFEFTVTFNAAGTYSYSGNGVSGGTIMSGGRITLAHGQSITIKGLPKGTVYTVTEADYTAEGYIGTSTNETGMITGGTTKTAAFTNTLKAVTPGALMIQKTVVGDDYSKGEVFTFVVTFEAGGRYPYSGSKAGTIASGEAIKLSHGESVEIMGLPAGTAYHVTEREANHNGYYTSTTGATGNVSASGSVAAFVNTRMSVPKTGGNGGLGAKIGMAAFTAVLILLSAQMSLRTKRRPGRR